MGINLIKESDIASYVYGRLIKDGYTPTADEILDLSAYVFDFLIEKEIVEVVE